jgi:hypothetical protein
VVIRSVILAKFSPVQAKVFAEAGDKVKTANAAATTRFFIMVSSVLGSRPLLARVFSVLRFTPEPEWRPREAPAIRGEGPHHAQPPQREDS